MLGEHFYYLQVLHGNSFVTHLAGHAEAFENLCRIGARAYGAGGALTVVLTVSLLTYTAKAMAFHYALIAFAFRCAYNVYEATFGEDVYGER